MLRNRLHIFCLCSKTIKKNLNDKIKKLGFIVIKFTYILPTYILECLETLQRFLFLFQQEDNHKRKYLNDKIQKLRKTVCQIASLHAWVIRGSDTVSPTFTPNFSAKNFFSKMAFCSVKTSLFQVTFCRVKNNILCKRRTKN